MIPRNILVVQGCEREACNLGVPEMSSNIVASLAQLKSYYLMHCVLDCKVILKGEDVNI
jgi:hypothetical protein